MTNRKSWRCFWNILFFVPIRTFFLKYRKLSCKNDLLNTKLVETNSSLKVTLINVIGLLQQWVRWCSHPKMICNHNIISRNEKNRSKLVILQSFSTLCYIFRKWEHFQITTFNRVYMAGGQALPSSNFFPYKSS